MPYLETRSAFVLIALQPMLDWVNAQGAPNNQLTLDDLLDRCEVYLVPNFETDQEMNRELDAQWKTLFELELSSWTEDEGKWPKDRTMDLFFKWFRYMPFNGVHDLVGGEVEVEGDDIPN